MKTLSLDASTTHIGWSVFDEDDLITYGLIEAEKKMTWRERIGHFSPMLKEVVKKILRNTNRKQRYNYK